MEDLMRNTAITAALVATFLIPAALIAAPEGWHKNIEEGQKASRQSGKPLLVITTWNDGV
jgi:hypothetical protein